MSQSLIIIIDKLRHETTRWDGILELKLFQGEHIEILIHYLKDPDWVVRWCISEKLGDIGDIRALNPLFDTFVDPDSHVRKNSAKAISKFGAKAVPRLVTYFSHPNAGVRKMVYTILLGIGKNALPILERHLIGHNWIIVSRIVDLIWRIGGSESEDVIVRSLQLPDVRKQSIILLGQIKSRRSVLYLLKLFDKFSLRRVILHAFRDIGEHVSYPYLVKSVSAKSKKILVNGEIAILKIGRPILPYLVQGLSKPSLNRKKIVDLISKIGPESVMLDIHLLSETRKPVAVLTQSLRDQFPQEKKGFFNFLKT